MKWARIDEDGVMREFTFIDPVGRFHPSLVWVEVADEVEMYSRFTLAGIEPPIPHQEVKGSIPEDADSTQPPAEMPPPDASAKGEDDPGDPPEGFTVQSTPA